MAAIATIKTKLPFLIDLSVEERKALLKLGDKSRAFVSKALEVATQNPDFLPRSFDFLMTSGDVFVCREINWGLSWIILV